VQTLGQPPGPRVIVREPLDVVVERVDPGRSDDPRLPHRTAELVLESPGLPHQLVGAGDQRPERAPEPLGEADRDRVEVSCDLRSGHSARHCSVEHARPVEMDRKLDLPAGGDERPDLVERPNPPTRRVVRVLDCDDAGRGDMGLVRPPQHLLDVCRAEAAGDAADRSRHQTRMHGGAPELRQEDVSVLLCDQLVTRLRQGPEGDLVRHRRGGNVNGLLLSEQLGDPALELVDGRVLAPLLVADLGLGYRLAHAAARLGLRIRTKVDHDLDSSAGPRRRLPSVPEGVERLRRAV
jgi:hypothetical protein